MPLFETVTVTGLALCKARVPGLPPFTVRGTTPGLNAVNFNGLFDAIVRVLTPTNTAADRLVVTVATNPWPLDIVLPLVFPISKVAPPAIEIFAELAIVPAVNKERVPAFTVVSPV